MIAAMVDMWKMVRSDVFPRSVIGMDGWLLLRWWTRRQTCGSRGTDTWDVCTGGRRGVCGVCRYIGIDNRRFLWGDCSAEGGDIVQKGLVIHTSVIYSLCETLLGLHSRLIRTILRPRRGLAVDVGSILGGLIKL